MGWLPLVFGSSLDPATTAWVSAVVAASGTVSGTQQGYVDTLVKGLKSNSLFSVFDRVWLKASENIQQANIDIINLATWTNHGLTFSANHGYTGDGSSTYGDLSFIPSSAGGHFAQDSASFGVYSLTSRATGAMAPIGVYDASIVPNAGAYLQLFNTGPIVQCDLNGQDFTGPAQSGANANGLWLASRTTSSSIQLYHNGSAFGSAISSTSTTLPTKTMLVGALNNNGTSATFDSDQIAATFIGGGLTSGQVSTLTTLVNAYMTSLGINVF